MKVRFGARMAGWPCRLAAATLGLVLAGCEPPNIVPVAPPGAPLPRTDPNADDPAQAQGEVVAPSTVPGTTPMPSVAYTPALPTARGETKTTTGGVKYETLHEGTGAELKPGQPARFYYVGRLEDGKIFDQRPSESGKPADFTIGKGVIEGWQEGLPGMKVGEKRKLIVPPDMAYGSLGREPSVPPNATLIFEVELVEIPNG